MCGIIDAIGDCFKTAIACVCFLLIGGPILIVMGSIALSKPDNRNIYNEAVKAFDPKPIEAWDGKINGVSTIVSRESLNIDRVDPAVSVYAQATVPRTPSSGSSRFSVSVNVNNIQSFVRDVPDGVKKTKKLECSSSTWKCQTEIEEFKQRCVSSGGDYKIIKCSMGYERCGACTRYLFLTAVYLVVSETSPGQFTEDVTLKSALYNFGDFANIYTRTQSSTVDVRLYSSKDPRIALERYTKGSRDFGADKRKTGIVMVVVGSLLLLLEIAFCAILVCFICRRKSASNANAGNEMPTGQGASPSYAYGNMPPDPYGAQYQPQMQGYAYGQPPPGQGYAYGQPPPGQGDAYGQPPPGQGYAYGQPPPGQGYAYGQPPAGQGDAYGQPPPGQGYAYGQPLPGQGYAYGGNPAAK